MKNLLLPATLIGFFLFFLSSPLSAQLRLMVEGDGQLSGNLILGQGLKTDLVGIGMPDPLVPLHVGENRSVLFGADTTGSGGKLIWLADKSAFRVGALEEDTETPQLEVNNWNIDSVGRYSFAAGLNAKALGDRSSVAGGYLNTASGRDAFVGGGAQNTASGGYAFVGGGNLNGAWGDFSFVGGGSGNRARGDWSYVGGGSGNSASGDYSFVAGGRANTASGDYSYVPGGLNLKARSFGEVVIGINNEDYSPVSATGINSTDRLFVVGNGVAHDLPSNALTILKNGYMGIGTSVPDRTFDLQGEMIVREVNKLATFQSSGPNAYLSFENNGGTSGATIGYFDDSADQYAFIDTPAGDFGELIILNNGNVGIGNNAPKSPLQITANASQNPDENGLHVFNPVNAANQHAMLSARVAGASAGDAFVSFDIFGEAGWSVGVDNDDANKLKFSSGWRSISAQTKMTIQVNGNVGIGTSTPAGKLDVAGDIYQNGALIHSDRRLKQNIRPIRSALDKIRQLEGVSYSFRSAFQKSRGFDKRQHLGLIAQEVERVFPELVQEGDQGYKAINYDGLIPVLIEGLKEQQAYIEELEIASQKVQSLEEQLVHQQREMDELKAMVEKLLAAPSSGTPIDRQTLELQSEARLGQNQPNPFHQNTLIPYFIPENIARAEIRITAPNGTLISRKELPARGQGQLNIKANSLPAGTYYYSLVLDGAVWRTEKMVLTK